MLHNTNALICIPPDDDTRPIQPVTKEEVETEKLRLRAIDARPIKKIAEAKGRQKRKAQAKMSQAREKAEAIAAQVWTPYCLLPFTTSFKSMKYRYSHSIKAISIVADVAETQEDMLVGS